MVKICTNETPYTQDMSRVEKLYPYKLSTFQIHAIDAILTNNHALITAHTGSGKTLPAEFAIQHFVNKMQKKVIYTAPIKALSNQKFHEFTQKYPDISFGILTGDIKYNPEADVLIMTTEILRNQLFNNMDSTKEKNENIFSNFNIDLNSELGCVIFDEVHYINDRDRGKIWEETIIHLPKTVSMVMLSATIDSPIEFAKWIELRNDNKTVFLTETTHRVVPLIHMGYLAAHESLKKIIKDESIKSMVINNCNKLQSFITPTKKLDESVIYRYNTINKYIKKNRVEIKRSYILNSLVKYLKDNDMLPAITFIFSRNQVENAAKEIQFSLHEDGSLYTEKVKNECEHILRKVPNYKEYLCLPEYDMILRLLEKGIAIHHAGMLPVFREMVEMLFSKNYIKLLFATETFAVGINMPTKTVIFTNIMKYDGNGNRVIHPHEYTQMAGRAGRRGLDKIGYVIHCMNLYDSAYTTCDYRNLLFGRPQKLVSKFNINYSLILQLIKKGHISDCNMINIDSIKQTMLTKEINNDAKQCDSDIKILEDKLEKEKLKVIKTPIESCEQYLKLKNSSGSQKAMKKNKRDANMMEDLYKTIDSDVETIKTIKGYNQSIMDKRYELDNINNYLVNQVKLCLNILKKNKLITIVDENYILLERGYIASNIQEVPGHVLSNLLTTTNYFKEYNVTQIVQILSFFTNLTGSQCKGEAYENDINMIFEQINNIYNEFIDDENQLSFDSTHYDEPHKIITNEIKLWCEAENYEDCYNIIQSLGNKNIFLGEFIRAILKIVNITNELIKIAEYSTEIEFKSKLSNIHTLLMKHVVTNTSLYI